MTKPEKPGSSGPRPFSMNAKDFLQGASDEQKKAATATSPEAPEVEEADADDAPPPSFRPADVAPGGSAGRASTHSRPPQPTVPKRKDEHTILMAVPPPAQENTGKKD